MRNAIVFGFVMLVLTPVSASEARADRTPYSDAMQAAEFLAARRGDERFDSRSVQANALQGRIGAETFQVKEFVFEKPLTEYELYWYAGLFDLRILEVELRKVSPVSGLIHTGRVYRLHEKGVETFTNLTDATSQFYTEYREMIFVESTGGSVGTGKDASPGSRNGDIYTVRFAGTLQAIGQAANALPATVFDVTLKDYEHQSVSEAIRADQARTQHDCHDDRLRSPGTGGTGTALACPPNPPPPLPPPAPVTVETYDMSSKFGTILQSPGNLPGPVGTIPTTGRILLCGIDPATGSSYRIPTTYGPTETEGNCPSDVTWAPEPEFGLYADNGFGGEIATVEQDHDRDPQTDPITYMIGSIGTSLRWGNFVLEVLTPNPGGGPDSSAFYLVNTMAFDGIRPLCDPSIDVSSATAPCGGVGSSRQTGVIGVPSPTYEDEIIIPNDFCQVNRDRCFRTEFIFSSLPCSYADTSFGDREFTPTAGSACAENIVSGTNYGSILNFSNRRGQDLTILARDTKHNGQIGTRRTLPVPIQFRVFAVDTRRLDSARFVPLPF